MKAGGEKRGIQLHWLSSARLLSAVFDKPFKIILLFVICLGIGTVLSGGSRAQAPVSGSLDAFLCYQARTTPRTLEFTPVETLPLSDQFEDSVSNVTKPEQLCNPAEVQGQALLDPTTHLEGYQLRPLRAVCADNAPQNPGSACKREEDCGGTRGETGFCESIPRHVKQRHLSVENPEFGSIVVDTTNPDRLLVPTSKCLDDPPGTCPDPLPEPDPLSHNVDHYKCYTVRVSPRTPQFPRDLQVSVVDQFDEPALHDVQKPTRLCNPVEKDGEPIKDIDTHLMCYQVRRVSKVCTGDAPANPGQECRRETDCGGAQRETSFCIAQPRHEKVLNIHVSNQVPVAD